MQQQSVTTGGRSRGQDPGAPGPGQGARFGAADRFPGPRWVLWGVVGGLVLLGSVTLLLVGNLQRKEMALALEQEGRRTERELEAVVGRLAAEELRPGGGGLEALGERLVGSACCLPAVLEIVVIAADRTVVRRFSRGEGAPPACLGQIPWPPAAAIDHEHPPGTAAPTAVGCLVYPLVADGETKGAVLFHTERDWSPEGERAGRTVRRTVSRLLPVFALFYVVLAALLVAATRAARRWRARANAAERVEALGAIAEGLDHEIRNPLNAVVLALQYLGRKQPDDEGRAVVETAVREAERIGATLREFARFTRVSRLEIREVALCRRLRERAEARGVPVDVDGEVVARVDPARIDEAFDAVLDLLARCAAPGTRPRLRIGSAGDEWRLEGQADAEGLDAAALDRLFHPYLRTGECDVGRGLALARAILQSHGGGLHAERKGSRLLLRGHAPKTPPGESR